MIKNSPPNARAVRDEGLIPGSGRSPGKGHGNLLHYSFLENPMDGGAWWATVHGVTKILGTTEVTLHVGSLVEACELLVVTCGIHFSD